MGAPYRVKSVIHVVCIGIFMYPRGKYKHMSSEHDLRLSAKKGAPGVEGVEETEPHPLSREEMCPVK